MTGRLGGSKAPVDATHPPRLKQTSGAAAAAAMGYHDTSGYWPEEARKPQVGTSANFFLPSHRGTKARRAERDFAQSPGETCTAPRSAILPDLKASQLSSKGQA